MNLPKNLMYNEYTWVKLDGNVATMGVTGYGLGQTKEIVFVDLPKKGQKIERGKTFVSLESVKWSGHLASPLSGEVIEANASLFDSPEKLNSDPYGSWICKLKLSKPEEIKALLNSNSAEQWVKKNLG